MMKNYLINSITVFVMCMAGMLISQLIPPTRVDLRWHSVIACAVIALVLGAVATWMQKRGWW